MDPIKQAILYLAEKLDSLEDRVYYPDDYNDYSGAIRRDIERILEGED